ncbi:TetR family transcriptional regulator [Streptomyces sp. SID3212]|uniref:TetR family transcriptional regulator n=1 Tax=Streptomyces sp. SID3212 TaxID=2690259 RepID=UPI00136C4ED6|nr:TetR family transcriptional regulator [Streptomyces sp. SID3212]MYV56656.1 TetR family transcriptional regulator [Streptomyces sp. SID3212]
MSEVAERADTSLGALYRRWPGKRDLVVAALRAAATRGIDVVPTDDPEADLLEGMVLLAQSLNGGARPPAGPPPGRIRDRTLTGDPRSQDRTFRAAHRQRLRRLIGSPPDFEERAALGPALIILITMTTGHPPDRAGINARIMPLHGPR